MPTCFAVNVTRSRDHMTVFKQIIDGLIDCEKVFENENFIAIKDRFPQAPVHLLIIPKKPIPRFQDIPGDEMILMAEAGKIVQELAAEFGIADGYRVVINNGAEGGQAVFHLHIHLLGGRPLGAIA
ncbi:HIT-like protein CPn_0488/CP_0266/CPj0488/CpB0508 [Chlamydia pneumoniae]|nr:HIT family protein [Chlamydia pneumoniae AR39]CRI32999.1 HIT-like protein CPn_0488/CP_0266/CPj0488/CpB0508 [Chlamydia pneumoniae]CRI35862.1 HIT-like protein CPn_0488/CP_0266/CPj0488/CpB0508 [Chlamydia pneumoniae]CRI36989.1 HIT-like protein CPn_0488/CP_0266/CPj0488/CpB0508 [Chlamydia pneumoniae]CRI38114.1 HIT-like protein CPn_0488/CP_0266/CPj0488/CpB0508 [Chlamydia pneumoniae]